MPKRSSGQAARVSWLEIEGVSDLSGFEYLTGLMRPMIIDFACKECVVKNDTLTSVVFVGGDQTSITVIVNRLTA